MNSGGGMIPPPQDRARANLYQSNGRSASPPPAANRMEESGRSDAPRYPIRGFDPINTFRYYAKVKISNEKYKYNKRY